MPSGTDITAAGDQLQSCASRMADFISNPAVAVRVPYEVQMAALEARDAITAWTNARTATPPWQDNSIQFPRLLAEIVANVELTVEQHTELCASMDLEADELNELFERAQAEWERILEATR